MDRELLLCRQPCAFEDRAAKVAVTRRIASSVVQDLGLQLHSQQFTTLTPPSTSA